MNVIVRKGSGHVWLEGEKPLGRRARAALMERLKALNGYLDRRNDRSLRRQLAAIFAMTKPNGRDSADPEALIDLYAAKLGDLPIWAVTAAMDCVARGRGESKTFAPALPELYRLAEAEAEPWLRERAKISAVLSAKVESEFHEPTPEERERAVAKWEQLRATFRGERI